MLHSYHPNLVREITVLFPQASYSSTNQPACYVEVGTPLLHLREILHFQCCAKEPRSAPVLSQINSFVSRLHSFSPPPCFTDPLHGAAVWD